MLIHSYFPRASEKTLCRAILSAEIGLLSRWYATLFGIAAGILALLACGVCYMASKERKGEPLFAPKPASNPMRDDLEKA